MKINRKSALKLIGLQVAIILVTFITQVVMVFFSQNKVLVIMPKHDQSSFYGLYASAKVDYLDTQKQLEQCKADKLTAEKANNPELFTNEVK